MNLKHLSLLILGTALAVAPLFAQLTYDWGNTMGSSGRDELTDLALDPTGNVYITGIFEDSIDVSNGAGTASVSSNGWRDGLIAKYYPDGTHAWSVGFGNAAWDRGWAIAVDSSGSVYGGGVFSNKVDFDPSPDSAYLISNQAGVWPDGYLVKYDTDGKLLWANHILTARDRGASQTATLFAIHDMEVDHEGNLIIGGAFWDSVWLSPSSLLVSDGPLRDMFLAKYDGDGNLIWAQQMGGASDQEIRGIDTDSQGNIFVGGYYFGTADFDPSANEDSRTSMGAADMFIAKYSSDGDLSWVHGAGSSDGVVVSPESVNDVAVDESGNVLITGVMYGGIDFDPSSTIDTLALSSPGDIFTAKYNNQGELIGAFSLDGNGTQIGKRLAILEDGSFYLGGEYSSSSVDLDPSADSSVVFGLSHYDLFVALYDSNFVFLEGRAHRGLQEERMQGLAAHGNQIVVGGHFSGSTLLDQQSGDLRFSKGDSDIFFAKYGEETTSIHSEVFNGHFVAFPNPASHYLNIRGNWERPQSAILSLSNIHGQQLYRKGFISTQEIHLQLPLAPYPAGIYFLELSMSGTKTYQKIILE
ncbi:MAG: SBBP repeat-containing protein [Bacteroidota bacterium]